MAERNVRDVVQQRGHANQLGLLVRNARRATHGLDDPLGHPRRSEGMLEAGVHRRRKNKVGCAELLNAPQTLEFRRIDDLDLQGSQLNITVDGITDQLPSHGDLLSYDFGFSTEPFASPHNKSQRVTVDAL